MKRISLLSFLFGLLFAILILGPAAMSGAEFGLYPLVTAGDVLDLITPLVLMPLYWLLFQLSLDQIPGQGVTIMFMAAIGAWSMGQGLHLAANAIGHLIVETGGDLYELNHFFDEVLSHYIWHGAIAVLSLLILYRQFRNAFADDPARVGLLTAGAILYGLTFALATLEGGTAPLGVPFAIITALYLYFWGRDATDQRPMVRYFLIAYLLAAVVFIIWALFWSVTDGHFSFPQPSEKGLI